MTDPHQEFEFDEDWYLTSYPDVAAAVRAGGFASGLQHYLAYGRAEGRSPLPPFRTTAIMTMVYNENTNLPIWLRHYRRTSPHADLFVIDHGSDDGSTENLSDVHKIPLPRTWVDEHDRTFLINCLQQGFLRYYDVVIYTDCDELLVPDPAKSPTLEAHLREIRYAYASPIGINVIHIVGSEPPIDFTRPLLLQRRHGQFHSQMCKPVVTRVPLKWEPGFHSCDRPLQFDKYLYLFHIKQIDKDEALRRQRVLRQLRWSKRAIEGNQGAHQRLDDECFLREFFLEPADELRRLGVQEFAFEPEITRLLEETHEDSGVFRTPTFRGPIVEIPEIFRSVF